jgi:hypothetical protein
MSYSKLYIKKGQKALAILGIVSFLSFFVGMTFFVTQLGKQNGWQKTSGIDTLYIVNRSPHGFEVIWSVKNSVKEEQWVEVGTVKESYPIRGTLENVGGVYRSIIAGLKPDTTYYFRVRVGTKTYNLPSLNSKTVHTPKEVKEKPVSPAYGKVILPSTRPYANGVLIYEIDGYYPLAVITKETGEWLIPLTGLVEKKNDSITSVNDAKEVILKLFSYPKNSIRTTIGQTRPLKQTIMAGTTSQIAQTIQKKDANESVLGTYTQNTVQTTYGTSAIIYPKENALIPGNTPLIRGTGLMGSEVTILIQGPTKQYSYRAKTDETGNWLVQNPLVLEFGRYTISATIKSADNTPTIITRSFNIIKSGEQVLGVATGTPTLIPTIPILPTTTSPTLIPTSFPTGILSPTMIIPTRFTPTATPPVTGGGMTGFLFGALICITVGAGLVLAF